MDTISLFDQSTIDQLPWPSNPKSRMIKDFFIPIMEKGPHEYIQNVDTKFQFVHFDDKVIPITVENSNYDNSFVCSPYGQYVKYAKETVSHLDSLPLRYLTSLFMPIVDGGWKFFRMNKVVIVNNWCLPTNLYPKLERDKLLAMIQHLIKVFPDHTIVFRSLYPHQAIFETLKENAFQMIPSRLCYFIHPDDNEPFKSRMMKSDLKLIEKTDYEVITKKDVIKAEVPRILELYQHLYIEKYSKLNLQFTEKFIEHILNHDAFEMILLKKNHQIDGVVAYYQFDNIITSPFFGYDTSKPQKTGLYRMLNAHLILEARKRNVLLNQSAGASSFKKLRRAKPEFEYLAAYSKHLPLHRQLPWNALKTIMTKIGIPLLNKFDI